jgi:type I restriction enzyme, S subunit
VDEWTIQQLGDLAEIVTGATPKESEVDSWGDDVDFITPSDQRNDSREAHPERRLSKIGAQRLRRRVVPAGSTNLTCIGSTIGKVSMAVHDSATNQQINSLIARNGVTDPTFLYYMIKNWSSALHLEASGSATPIVNKSLLARYEFKIPILEQQCAIGQVLDALDDKIAANDRMLRLCLELADARFASCVRDVQLSDKTFGDIADVGGGGTPKTSIDEYWSGDISWATPTDATGLTGPYIFSTSRTITQAGLGSCASRLYPKGSILMTSRATIGAFALAQMPIAVNQGFIVVNAKESVYQFWLFHEMRARISEFISHANGATFLELSRGKFKKFQVRVPDMQIVREFSQEVEKLHVLASQMTIESSKLANTRDELLPLLMSGRARVREAEKIVEGVV